MASEGFIQFIWKHKLYRGNSVSTCCGAELEILHPGEQNLHAGPDFFNARIKLDRLVWAGNVEVHRRASDWYKHGHHLNPGYNNVILHVVGDYDTDVTNSLGRRVPTMVPEYNSSLLERYDTLKRSENWIPCSDFIGDIPDHRLKPWLRSLHSERATQKTLRMEQILMDSALNPDESLYKALAPGYGMPVNTFPFELLAKGVPFHLVIEHRDSLADLEAIFFGQSGLLRSARELGSYPSSLWNRYTELQNAFAEKPLPRHLWKFLRLRPPSFPTLRISQFASLIHQSFPLSSCLTGSKSVSEMEQFFRCGASAYWDTHYLFGRTSPHFPKFPGEQFITTLIINVVLPFLHALDKQGKGNIRASQTSEVLLNLKAESNLLIKNWAIFGVRASNAMESQALLQLYHAYCKKKRCLDCQVGVDIVKTAGYEKK